MGCCQGFLITGFLLPCKLEDKNSFMRRLSFNGVPLRAFDWQHPNSCVMPQLIDLFCHKILLAKFNKLTSFRPLPFKYWGSTYPRMIFHWRKAILSLPYKLWGDFFLKKLFMADEGGGRGWGTIYRGLLCMGD